jgi:hypothetical protein
MAYGNWRLTFGLRDVRNEVSNGEKTSYIEYASTCGPGQV